MGRGPGRVIPPPIRLGPHPGLRRWRAVAWPLVCAAIVLPDVAQGQQDTIIDPGPPSVEPGFVPADTLALPDSLASDSTVVFVPRNLSLSERRIPPTWSAGVWEWDAEGLRGTRALTLLELLEEIPGVEVLRGGDLGQPSSVSAFGAGPGRVRVYLDGAELAPLDGGVVDLSRVGIAALGSVRVERRGGELRIDLTPIVFQDPRPESYLEVGTGDLNTNLFRGMFAHPDALGGTVTAMLDRIDTSGPRASERGVSFGAGIRHTVFPMDRLAVAWELRRMTSQRPEDLWSPEEVTRSELGLRARYEALPWLSLGLIGQRSSLATEVEQGAKPDSLISTEARSQVALKVSADRDRYWADAEFGVRWGPGWPETRAGLRAGGTLERLGGASVGMERETWTDGTSTELVHARAWTSSFRGFSGFVGVEDGSRGVPYWVPPPVPADTTTTGGEEPEPEPEPEPNPISVTNRTAFRVGVEYRRSDLFLGGALLSVEADSLHPLGLPADRDGLVTPGGSRTALEASVVLPLAWLLDGLSVRGSAQFWEEGEAWRYLPDRSYSARVSFHDIFYDSQNLEVWGDVGVTGRDPMQVPVSEAGEALQTLVPFEQSWFLRVQVRVASARLFIRWDNFTLRPANQDYPDRVLPQTRAMYGIRWTLWN